jgi:septum formation protein
MLEQAGIRFDVVPPDIDESADKNGGTDPAALAIALSRKKALAVSGGRPGDWVIGSDSVVTVSERRFDKPIDRAQAKEHLRFFSGKPMQLTSAAALARDGRIDWSGADRSTLRVRQLSDSFIADYLDSEWPEVRYCVGVFRLEGRGVQLFEAIEGSYFTTLGMPLLPLLSALRDRGLAPA